MFGTNHRKNWLIELICQVCIAWIIYIVLRKIFKINVLLNLNAFGHSNRKNWLITLVCQIVIACIIVLRNIFKNQWFVESKPVWQQSLKQLAHWVNLFSFIRWITVLRNILKKSLFFSAYMCLEAIAEKLAHRVNLSSLYSMNDNA